ncbi:gamma-glutamyltransferase [Nocardioides sp. SOB77]|uniref:Gamma-glutamyltransferase n=1 Tax=Nocardioides oceani TaxID=3058369 RepID=A0ABT8FHP9_9ACTN|nr:gamma-glutamyltransferase [Nocardioides oceani]MDN4174203.1 gamma-glutamyltransferase [Nocardioides oceani]
MRRRSRARQDARRFPRTRRWLRRIGIGFLVLVVVLGCVYWALPKGPRDPMDFDSPKGETRTMATGTEYAVVAGTPWAAEAMRDVLEAGGNAADAAIAGLLTLNVTFGEAASFPGVAPLLFRDGRTGEVSSYTGAGTAPAAATLERFRDRDWDEVPEMDVWAQLLPASPDVLVSLLRDHGTMAFAELAAPAIELARTGFPVHEVMAHNLDFSLVERIGFQVLMPYNAHEFTKGEWWRPIHVGDRFKRPDLAETLEALGAAETAALEAGGDREAGLQAVRDHFYAGPLAEEIVELQEEEDGLITAADLAGYAGEWEEPLASDFHGSTIRTNRTWNQGIVVPMALEILEGIDLEAMGWGSEEYVHTVLQAIDLAMADREAYVADPAYVDVPVAELLSPEHAAERRAQMGETSYDGMPAAGDVATAARPHVPDPLLGKDTTHLAVVDARGDSVTLTPSDFPLTPMVPGTGMNLGNRMTQFSLDPDSPNRLEPGKRPRITPHAVMVDEAGGGQISLGTPGGDVQAQTNLQVLLNILVWGMDLQEAVEAPRFMSLNFPSSFTPHVTEPHGIKLEAPLDDELHDALEARGYEVERLDRWDHELGGVGIVRRLPGGRVEAGADPHESTTAFAR